MAVKNKINMNESKTPRSDTVFADFNKAPDALLCRNLETELNEAKTLLKAVTQARSILISEHLALRAVAQELAEIVEILDEGGNYISTPKHEKIKATLSIFEKMKGEK